MMIFKVYGLISALKQRGINIKGNHKSNKKDKKLIEDGDPLAADMVESCAKNLAGKAFDTGAYQELLEHYRNLIQEEHMYGETFHAPTYPEGEVQLAKK